MLKHGEWCWLDDGQGTRIRLIADSSCEKDGVLGYVLALLAQWEGYDQREWSDTKGGEDYNGFVRGSRLRLKELREAVKGNG